MGSPKRAGRGAARGGGAPGDGTLMGAAAATARIGRMPAPTPGICPEAPTC